MVVTDSIFRIGDSHKVCQDYAINGKDYIIVSDGCSSSENTDLGARLVTLAARKHRLMIGDSWGKQGEEIIGEAAAVCEFLRQQDECLDATLLLAVAMETRIHVRVWGDGNVIVQKKDDTIEVININFESGAPFYLSYKLDQERTDRYPVAFPGKLTAGDRELVYHAALSWEFDRKEIKSITLATDGFDSFLKDKRTPVQLEVGQVLGFKNTKGAFLERRMERYLKQLKAEGVDHYDDLGIATMLFEEE